MNKSELIASVIAVAKTVLPLVPFGREGLAAGEAVLRQVAAVREVVGATPEHVAEFEATREELERRVAAHADRTAANLAD